MSAVRGLAEAVLLVRDLDKSLHFYRDALGLTVISPPDFKGPAVFLQIGQSTGGVPPQIVLSPLPTDAPPADRARRNVHHFGIELSPEDFDKERDRLENLGFPLRFGEHPFLPLQAMYIDDPDGNEVELVTVKK